MRTFSQDSFGGVCMFPTKDDDCQVVRPGLGQGKAVIGGAQDITVSAFNNRGLAEAKVIVHSILKLLTK